jgi:DNA/RNA-binding domain of Phe-tRNA-synthetase-like protein
MNRQSGLSAVQNSTAAILIVAEAMHDSAASDVPELTATIADGLHALWTLTPTVTVVSQCSPRFTFD